MDKLPVEVTREASEYDYTCREQFYKVLMQLRCHRFIYNCQICFK